MKYLIITLSFCVSYFVFNFINFYQIKHITPTIWALTKFNFILLPVYLVLNVLVTMTFNKAYISIGKIWPVTIMYWGAGVIGTVVLTFIFFKEVPKSNGLIRLILTLRGIFIANYK